MFFGYVWPDSSVICVGAWYTSMSVPSAFANTPAVTGVAPARSLIVVVVTVDAFTSSLKLARTVVAVGAPTPHALGLVAVIVGGAVSVIAVAKTTSTQ